MEFKFSIYYLSFHLYVCSICLSVCWVATHSHLFGTTLHSHTHTFSHTRSQRVFTFNGSAILSHTQLYTTHMWAYLFGISLHLYMFAFAFVFFYIYCWAWLLSDCNSFRMKFSYNKTLARNASVFQLLFEIFSFLNFFFVEQIFVRV